MRIPAFHFLFGWMIAPLTRRRMAARAEARMDRLKAIEAKVCECQTRESLESLLGPPRYALRGDSGYFVPIGQSVNLRPDVIEVYESDDCTVTLQFKGGEITSVTSYPVYATWERIAVATDRNLRRQARVQKALADQA
jgi:hypothetical protein